MTPCHECVVSSVSALIHFPIEKIEGLQVNVGYE